VPPDFPKVGFLIAGTQRGGTTTLRHYLARHPEVCMSHTKELHFFDNEKIWRSSPPDYGSYHAAFRVLPQQRLLGEATPIYMFWKPAIARIRGYNPDMKLIMILRNPVTRAYSHWNFERLAGREALPFRDALLAEPSRSRKVLPEQLRNASYVARGMYTAQLMEVWRCFPREQTLVLRFEDLHRDTRSLCARVAAFLDIEPFAPIGELIANAWDYPAPLSAEDGRYLAGIFEEEISSLERVLGWDCSEWRAQPGA
jgi:hypothetical protein